MADSTVIITAQDRTAAAFASVERNLSKTTTATTRLASNMLKLAGVGTLMVWAQKNFEATEKWRDEMGRLDRVTSKFFETTARSGSLDGIIWAIKIVTSSATGLSTAFSKLIEGVGAVGKSTKLVFSGEFREAGEVLSKWKRSVDEADVAYKKFNEQLFAPAPHNKGKPDDAETKKTERLKQQIIALDQSLMTQEERLQLSYDNRSMMLEDAWMRDITSTQKYQELQQQLELDHQAKLGDAAAKGILQRQKLEQMTASQQAAFYFGHLAKLTQGAATHNRAMFELNKVAGIANAYLAANQGAAEALKWGYPMGPIFAGLIWAAAAVNIAQIRSASFGSSTSAPSVAGGTAVPVQPIEPISSSSAPETQQQTQNVIQVTIQGNVLGNEEFVRETLIPAIQDEINDRSVVIIQSGSRQAQELAT